jgi:arylsulfatase A-like enzyme
VRLGRFVAELGKRGLLESTLIVVSAKHGQAPIDPAQRHIIDGTLVPNIVNGVQPGLLSQATEDDLAVLWLTDHSQTEAVVDALQANRAALGISTILSGDRLEDGFNSVRRDPRAPDAIVLVQQGVIYAKPTATKLSEHGGFGHDDTNVPILLSAPGIRAEDRDDPVTTTQIAPTILEALGLNPGALDAVRIEGTRTLPIDFDTRPESGR